MLPAQEGELEESDGEGEAAFAIDPEDLPEGWQAATLYHRLKRVLPRDQRQEVEDRAVREILRRARDLLRHTSRPRETRTDAYPAEGELDLDRTLEQPRPWRADDLAVSRTELRRADVVAILDMSLSMTGDKVALTALACAILHLKLDRLAVVHFDTKAHRLVSLAEQISADELVRRILRVPAQGFTNIDGGLRMGLELLRASGLKERAGILMTDGVANVGGNPLRAAARYPHLHVVQVGEDEPQGRRTCAAMAQAGRGRHYRAELYADLPAVVRRLVRESFGG